MTRAKIRTTLPEIAARLLAVPPLLYNYFIAVNEDQKTWPLHQQYLDAALLVLERDDSYSLRRQSPPPLWTEVGNEAYQAWCRTNPDHPTANDDRARASRRAAQELMTWAWCARDALTAERRQRLFRCLVHWDSSVRFDLLRGLGFIADSSALPWLHELLRLERESPNCGAMAAALIEAFSQTTADPDTSREAASSSLIALPPPPIVVVREWRGILRQLSTGRLDLHSLPWKQFEELVAHVLEAHGWEITPMGYTKDGGVDIAAVRPLAPGIRFNMMVQCKRFSAVRKVGVELVRQVWAVKSEKGFHQAMLATTSTFTSGAKETAAIWDLELKDRDDILAWCSRLARSTGTSAVAGESDTRTL